MARDTVALWVAFFCCLFAIYSAFSWLPTVLTTEGFSPQVAGAGLTAYNLGGVFGALGCAQLIARFGSRWPMIICAAGGAAMALLLKLVPNDQTNLWCSDWVCTAFSSTRSTAPCMRQAPSFIRPISARRGLRRPWRSAALAQFSAHSPAQPSLPTAARRLF